jgi:hypothetical protein
VGARFTEDIITDVVYTVQQTKLETSKKINKLRPTSADTVSVPQTPVEYQSNKQRKDEPNGNDTDQGVKNESI